MQEPKPKQFKGKEIAKGKEGKPNFRNSKSRISAKKAFNRNGRVEDLKAETNDPKFYNRYKALADTAARIAFNHRNGSHINFAIGGTIANRNIDPIMVLTYIPTIGKSDDKTSGINMAAQAAYKVLNRKYRGSLSSRYQAADFGISQFAIMDFYLSLAQAERAYGLCQTAKVNQRQLPREIVLAAGFDYEDIAAHMADFRAGLDALIVQAQQLCLIKGYPMLEHHLFLLSNVFKDKDTDRAQYFMYKKPGYWLWNPTKFATGSALEWVPNTETKTFHWATGSTSNIKFYGLQTYANCLANLQAQLAALLSDSDIDSMCADILALFDNKGDSELIKLSFLPDGYSVDAIYDKNALYQLHNTIIPCSTSFSSSRVFPLNTTNVERNLATPYPLSVLPTGETGSNHTGLFIYQLSDAIRFDCNYSENGVTQLTEGVSIVYGNTSATDRSIVIPILDTDILLPSTDEVLEMTRNTSIWYRRSITSGGSTYYIHYLMTMGSTLIASCLLFDFYTPGAYTVDSNGDYDYGFNTMETSIVDTHTTLSNLLSRYDWYPILNHGGNGMFADLDNYVGVDYPTLKPIHEAALLSEFHNPVSDELIKDV